jgi:hypothetical protein
MEPPPLTGLGPALVWILFALLVAVAPACLASSDGRWRGYWRRTGGAMNNGRRVL